MKHSHVFHAPWLLRASLMLFMTFSVQCLLAQLNLNTSRTTLGKVIEQIKSQSSYNFFYDDKLASLAVCTIIQCFHRTGIKHCAKWKKCFLQN